MHETEGLGTFGRYLLVEDLAAGGMGRVYRAVLRGGPGFEKQVALKRVLRELGEDEEFVGRFADEARIASTLSHGNIVQVFDFGELDGEYYLAMELVDGPDLGSLIAASKAHQQPIPVPTALFVASEFCRGLAAAHRRQDKAGNPAPVVHRDVSPQNVLLSRDGGVKVTDFGIAKAADKALRTQTGMLMGKVRYMAPEQARAEVVDARADVFAAGCVLFEMLVGRPLFDGRSPEEVLLKVVQGPIPKVSELVKVPPGLDAILDRALDRDRDARYEDGGALARDLERLLHVIAPGFSRDDLAALVDDLVPPPRLVQQRPTRPVGTAQALEGFSTIPDDDLPLAQTAFALTSTDQESMGAEVTPQQRPAPAGKQLTPQRTSTLASVGGEDMSYAPTEPPPSAAPGGVPQTTGSLVSGPGGGTDAYRAALRAELGDTPPSAVAGSIAAPAPASEPAIAAVPSVQPGAQASAQHDDMSLSAVVARAGGRRDGTGSGSGTTGSGATGVGEQSPPEQSAPSLPAAGPEDLEAPSGAGETPVADAELPPSSPGDVELLLHPKPPTLIGRQAGGEPTEPVAPGSGGGRRLLVATLVALLLGALGGGAAAFVLAKPAPLEEQRATLGAELALSGGWTMKLLKVQRQGSAQRHLRVTLELRNGGEAAPAALGASFRLQAGGALRRPQFWRRVAGGLELIFEAPSPATKLILELRDPPRGLEHALHLPRPSAP